MLYAPVAYVYGLPDYQSLISLLATNTGEATEFLSQIPAKVYLKSVLIPLLALISFIFARNFEIKPWKNKTFILLSLVCFLLVLEPTSFVRKTINAGKVTSEQLKELEKFSKQSNWGVSKTDSENKDYVLIIGESARKDYFHNYGYPVSNTPFLDSVNSIQVNGLKSGGTYTIGSLTNMLTDGTKQDWKPRYDYSLIDLAKSAGIKTYWISNQGLFGRWDTPISGIAYKSDKTYFLNSGKYEYANQSDFKLLRFLKHIVEEKSSVPRLIVLHTIGSHPDACRRVFDIKNTYKVKDHKYEYLSCYVRSIQKTDKLIQRVYSIMKNEEKKTGRSFSIIYFSDHGQIHTHTSEIKLNNNSTSKFHYDIPLIRMDSEAKEKMVLNSEKSGLRFTQGLAKWMGIKNPKLEDYDLFDGKSDPNDFGLKDKIAAIKNPPDPAIDITPFLKK